MTFFVGDRVRPKDNHLNYFRMVGKPFTKGTITKVRKKIESIYFNNSDRRINTHLVTVEFQDKDLRTYEVICFAERLELEGSLFDEVKELFI